MPDDPRANRLTPTPPTRPANALVASAKILTERRLPIPKPEAWQDEAWSFYDTTPEVRFAVGWLENALSRCAVYAARLGESGDDPERIEPPDPAEEGQEEEPEPLSTIEEAAVGLMAGLAGGTTGQARMLGAAAVHLSVPGDGYLVGVPGPTPEEEDEWAVYSADQISKRGDDYILQDGENQNTDKRVLPPEAIVVRYWRPHRRWSWKPDSPIHATLGVLRELALSTQSIEASLVSRLAGAGIILLPEELTFAVSDQHAEAEDPFIAELIDTMVIPIQDRSAASAVVPFVVRVKGEFLDAIKHLTFSTPLDERSLALREEAIKRFAAGMDLPAEVVMGLADSNHWTAWQIEESAVKLHVEPMLEAICEALTVGFLHPALEALGHDPTGLVVWYDATDLTVRPDRSFDAREAYRDGVIGWKAYIREIGLDPTDAPTDEELKRKIILDVITGLPSAAPQLLPLLGIDLEGVQADDLEPATAAPGAPAGPEPPAVPGTPDRAEGPADGEPEALAASGEAALVAAADGLVWRALEKAGARLSNQVRRAGLDDHGCDHATLHTCVPEEFRVEHVDALLAGAWDRVPEVAARHGVDPRSLGEALDIYTRALLASGWPHEYAALAAHLGMVDDPDWPAPLAPV